VRPKSSPKRGGNGQSPYSAIVARDRFPPSVRLSRTQFHSENPVTANSQAPLQDLTTTAVRALMLYSLAEFQCGNATTIRVSAEGTNFSISDDGRGHPIDKTVEGTSYLKFIYTHFDYPFESARSAPVQLQGIGMSLVNALCSELALTVRKRDETLQVWFRDGRFHQSRRTAVLSEETGIAVFATINPILQASGVATAQLEEWLVGVLKTNPELRLYFNGRQLQPPYADAAHGPLSKRLICCIHRAASAASMPSRLARR
jgi:hypothetical protein